MPEPDHTATFQFEPIAIARTPFNEKFAIPRQPNLTPSAIGKIELLPPFNSGQSTEGLEAGTYIWLIFVFHAAATNQIKQKVRPPRLGGNQSLGVFATRSPYRPNAIGQSLVKLDSVSPSCLMVSGIDLLDKTPILDIKPFITYADSVKNHPQNWAQKAPIPIKVTFTSQALDNSKQFEQTHRLPLLALIQECLAQNPKPAYQKTDPKRLYGCILWNMNVQFRYLNDGHIQVENVIEQCKNAVD